METSRLRSSACEPVQALDAGNVTARENEHEEAIVAEFRRQTGMNAVFSRQCLQEFGWHFEVALNAFRTIHASGGIPQGAFTQD